MDENKKLNILKDRKLDRQENVRIKMPPLLALWTAIRFWWI
jgi:hypothetical protein